MFLLGDILRNIPKIGAVIRIVSLGISRCCDMQDIEHIQFTLRLYVHVL